MKYTNYYLFDFLDFDTDLKIDESLWKAYKPKTVIEKNGDIIISVPFQKQKLSNEMAADLSEEKERYDIIIRAYGNNIVRLFCGFGKYKMVDDSEMLKYSDCIYKNPLTFVLENRKLLISDLNNVLRAEIDVSGPEINFWSSLQPAPQETLDITLYPDGKKAVRLSAYDHFSPPRYDALPIAFCKKDGFLERATVSFECTPDECFSGTGERFSKMDLSGHTFQLKNQDGQGVNNRRTYKNIPFYLSSRLYGAFFHTSSYGKLSLADQSSRSVQFLSEQPKIDVFLIGGASPADVLKGYRDLTGYPSMLPLWSFGVWMSRMTYFSAEEVEEICSRLRKEEYPCDVIHLDTGWFETDWLCEWKFNKERFPDPPAFLKRLKDNGFRVSLWQLPYVAEGAEQIDEARENNYICSITKKQKTDGSNFSALDYAGTIDFTNPEAVEWYKGLLKKLLEMGVVCIKTDFGENIHMDAVYKNMKPELLNNLYALLYQKAAYEVTKEVTGDGIIWARAAWAGCQRYPVHWGGDSASTWDGMAGSLKGGLHFGLSGFAFWSHDVPGFHSLPDFMNSPVRNDIYLRWTQFGVFSSHIRYHGSSAREPWHFTGIESIVKKWWRLRYALIPYIVEESRKAVNSGMPVLRALLLHYPEDKTCWHIDDEYFFGSKFLVAPVMNSENRRDIYFPKGEWVDLFTGLKYGCKKTGIWVYDMYVPLEIMPVFIKQGEKIPVYPEKVSCTDDMDKGKIETLRITSKFRGIFNELINI